MRVADTSRHPQVEELKTQHYQWLLQTAQQDKAAAVKELEGDYLAAISLYLKGGLPARAAQVLVQTTRPSHPLHRCCTTISPAAVHIVFFKILPPSAFHIKHASVNVVSIYPMMAAMWRLIMASQWT